MLTRRQFLSLGGATLAGAATGITYESLSSHPAVLPPLPPRGAVEPAPAPAPAVSRPFRVALLSDAHTQSVTSPYAPRINGKLEDAVSDLRSVEPDLWLCNGDVSDHGYPGEYRAFNRILGQDIARGRLLATCGNHEYYAPSASDELSRARFREAFGLGQLYNHYLFDGIHFVLLADEQYKTAPTYNDWAWLTPEQLRWFEQVLAEHPGRFTVVFLHQPLQETVACSRGVDGSEGTGQAKELRAILKRNPQIRLWFSGHTHYRLEYEHQVVQQGSTLFVALGSTCYQYVPASEPAHNGEPAGFRKDWGASQSRVMELWPDRVVVRARDHTARTWLDRVEVSVRRA